MYYAHTPNQAGEWHQLTDHLHRTAELAREFASSFGAGELAYYVGLWHDLGKFNPEFQAYLETCYYRPDEPRSRVDHKAAGSQLARDWLGPCALLIQGHHGGLGALASFDGWLREMAGDAAADALARARAMILDLEPEARLELLPALTATPLVAEFALRMLFSALVDADYLDTEQHFDSERTEQRRGENILTPAHRQAFEQNQNALPAQGSSTLAQARADIYKACLEAAKLPPGFFRLTVPTGGGKTRSGLAFALRHALKHDLRRVIVAVPFTTVTEQTARVYRSIFGGLAAPTVLEHHSQVEGYEEGSDWVRLTAENWDAPLIVTTTVQLFESLFACTPSRCRKLHRLARSVIILDEAQALPIHLLEPILDGLRQLVQNYGATVVFSTATQPAFDTIPVFANLAAREIVPEPRRYFTLLRRVEYDWQLDRAQSWIEVARTMRQERQILTIVNTRRHAQELLDQLADDAGVLHLSTMLCAAHRRVVVAEVRRRLAAGETCRLVSTQVVEAGVDLDFPFVMRSIAPLDTSSKRRVAATVRVG